MANKQPANRQQMQAKVLIDNAARLAVDFDDVVPPHLRLNPENAERALTAPYIAFDYETSNTKPEMSSLEYRHTLKEWGLSIHTDISFLGIAWGWGEEDGIVFRAPFTQDELDFLHLLFARQDCVFVAHNLPFDARLLGHHCGIPIPANTWDTQTAAFSMGTTEKDSTSLAKLCKAYETVLPGDVSYVAEDAKGKVLGNRYNAWIDHTRLGRLKGGRDSLDLFDQAEVAWYVLADVRMTMRLYDAQKVWTSILVNEYGYTALPHVHERDQEYINLCAQWAARGQEIDRDYAAQLYRQVLAEMDNISASLIPLGVGDLSKAAEKERFFFDIVGLDRPVPDVDEKGQPCPRRGEEKLWTDTMNYAFNKGSMKAYKQRIMLIAAEEGTDEEDKPEQVEGAEPVPVPPVMVDGEVAQTVMGLTKLQWLELYEYYSHLSSMKKALKGYLEHASLGADGVWRIYPTMRIGTVTGRSTSTNPNNLNVKVVAPQSIKVFNFQTGAVEERMTVSMRGVLVAPQGMELVEMDYSNAEKRTQTVLSQDIELAKALRDGKDLHTENARAYFAKEWKKIAETCECGGIYENGLCKEHKRLRNKGKAITFAADYGSGIAALAANMGETYDATKEMIDGFNRVYWGLARFKREAQRPGEVTWQKMRHCPHPSFAKPYCELYDGQRIQCNPPQWDPQRQRERTEYYKLVNYVQQGGVAAIVKTVILRVNRMLREGNYRSFLAQQVHDSLIVATVPEEAAEVLPKIAWIMMTAIPFEMSFVRDIFIPFPAEADLTENRDKWGYRADGSYAFEPVEWKEKKKKDSDETVMVPVYATYGCSESAVQQYIVDQHLHTSRGDVEALEALYANMLEDGPLCDSIPWVKPSTGKPAKRPWGGAKMDLAQCQDMAIRFHRQQQAGRLPDSWTPMVEEFVRFMRDILQVKTDLERTRNSIEQAEARLLALEGVG